MRHSKVYMRLGTRDCFYTAPPSTSKFFRIVHHCSWNGITLTYFNPGCGNQLTCAIKCKVTPSLCLGYVQLKESRLSASLRHLRLLYECQNSSDGGGNPLDMSKAIWVLLTRHLSHTCREAEYISLTVHHEDEVDWRDIWLKTGDTEVKVN